MGTLLINWKLYTKYSSFYFIVNAPVDAAGINNCMLDPLFFPLDTGPPLGCLPVIPPPRTPCPPDRRSMPLQ